MRLSVCVPVYYGEATIERLVETLGEEYKDFDLEIVLVNDGSKDGSGRIIRRLSEELDYVTAIDLGRNFGEHNAVLCALNYCTGDYAAIIDDDFQNPPAEIRKLLEESRKGFDVVYSKYAVKKHHPLRNLGSKFNDIMATWLMRKPKNLYLSSFKLISRRIIDEIVKYKGPFPYIDGLILRVTDNVSSVFVEHETRKIGRSNYTLGKLVALWLNMFVNFSIRPMRVISVVGFITAIFSFGLGVFFVVDKMLHPDTPIGWASLSTLVVFIGGIQTMTLGVIGEYIGKNYLDQNGTPQWTIQNIRTARKHS